MPTPASTCQTGRVLVSDFDGTMTRYDFYKLAIEKLLPADVPDFWAQYRACESTHFEALRRYFAAIRAPEYEVRAIVEQMELDPRPKQVPNNAGRHQLGGAERLPPGKCERSRNLRFPFDLDTSRVTRHRLS